MSDGQSIRSFERLTIEISLSGTDTQQLDVLQLEECGPQWKIDAHDPEVEVARVGSMQWIHDHIQRPVDLKTQNRGDGETHIALAYSLAVSKIPQSNRSREHHERPDDIEYNVHDPQIVEIWVGNLWFRTTCQSVSHDASQRVSRLSEVILIPQENPGSTRQQQVHISPHWNRCEREAVGSV